MGIVNVTPDSFYAEQRTFEQDAAVERGRDLFEQGAAVVDVGGESTRPGAEPVDLATELDRTVEVVGRLSGIGPVSIDTTKPEVARAAVVAGAVLINDVGGELERPRMLTLRMLTNLQKSVRTIRFVLCTFITHTYSQTHRYGSTHKYILTYAPLNILYNLLPLPLPPASSPLPLPPLPALGSCGSRTPLCS